MQLKGKRIIATGAAQGTGAGTVRAYIREGAVVSALEIADERGARVAEEANRQSR